MKASLLGQLIRRLPVDSRDDRQLLQVFRENADGVAFASLIQRYGGMVYGVCRRILSDMADVEDAFQTTFLVLVRRSPNHWKRESLGAWLHGVALRSALKIRTQRLTRQSREHRAAMENRPGEIREFDDSTAALDQEIAVLPEVYRAAIVLCELEGMPRHTAAKKLQISEGTLSSRLARGRKILRERLLQRGVAFGVLSAGNAAPAAWANATVTHAISLATGKIENIPVTLLTLTEGIGKTMFMKKLGVLALLAVVGFVAASWSQSAPPKIPMSNAAPPKELIPESVIVQYGDKQSITQGEFVAYLLKKYGDQEIQRFTSRKLLNQHAAKRGIIITQEQIDRQFEWDAKQVGLNSEDYASKCISKYGYRMETWKEEMILPRLQLEALLNLQQQPTEAELIDLFEMKYGERRNCRLIRWPEGQLQQANDSRAKLVKDAEAFEVESRRNRSLQFTRPLPNDFVLGKKSVYLGSQKVHPKILEAVSNLQRGEFTPIIDLEEGPILIRCDSILEARAGKIFDLKDEELVKELTQAWRQDKPTRMGRLLTEIQAQAKPKYLTPAPSPKFPTPMQPIPSNLAVPYLAD